MKAFMRKLSRFDFNCDCPIHDFANLERFCDFFMDLEFIQEDPTLPEQNLSVQKLLSKEIAAHVYDSKKFHQYSKQLQNKDPLISLFDLGFARQ